MWCVSQGFVAIKGLVISADVCPLNVLLWLKHAFPVWSCKWVSGTAGWMQMLSQGTASPCLWVSRHFLNYWGYFMSWFIGFFIFLAKQFELIQAIPFPPPPTLVKTPPFWLQSSESFITPWVFADLFFNLLVMDVQFISFSVQRWHVTWQWLGNPPVSSWPQHCRVLGEDGTSSWLKSSFLWEMLWVCPGMEVFEIKGLRVAPWET